MKNTEPPTLLEYQRLSNEFIKNLNGKNGQLWFSSFKRFLRGENPWDFKLWDEGPIISYGGEEKTSEKLIEKASQFYHKTVFSDSVSYLLKNIRMTEKKKTAELCIVPIKLLGLGHLTSMQKVNEKVNELGFHLLTIEMSINLFFQCEDLSDGIKIAMNPILFPGDQKFSLTLNDRLQIERFDQNFIAENYYVIFLKKLL